MAALWGLTILLLCAVNISLAQFCYDFDPSEIKQTVSTGLPATIEPTLPSECNHLSVDYTCSENGKVNDSKKLSELEPFTDYTCTGLIKVNNVPSDKRTTPIPVRIDCSFTPQEIRSMRKTTDTSIELTWTTTSDNCQVALPRLQNLSLSYDCSCGTSESKIPGKLIRLADGGKCSFTGLTPYTDYTCDIVPTYKQDKKDDQRQRVYQRTDAGKPERIEYLSWTLLENNVIKVSCDYRGRLFGPEKTFRARLINNDYRRRNVDVDEKRQERKKCEFEFKDLNYSWGYNVEVTVFNGVLESDPKYSYIHTEYNNKALIGSLCFPIIFTFVVALVVSYKCCIKKHRESRSDVNDDMMIKSTAIYVNPRPPGWRHKAAR